MQHLALDADRAAVDRDEPEHGPGDRRLSGARLPHQPEGLARPDLEGHVIDRCDDVVAAELEGLVGALDHDQHARRERPRARRDGLRCGALDAAFAVSSVGMGLVTSIVRSTTAPSSALVYGSRGWA